MKILKRCLLIFFICSCQKQTTSDLILITSTGGKGFSASFDKPNGAHWYSIYYDPEYPGFQITLEQGEYIATAITDDNRDTLRIEFTKDEQWKEIAFDW